MAAFVPFQPKIISSLAGLTKVITSGGAVTLDGTAVPIPTILVTNLGGSAWLRLSPEAAPTASATDTPIPASTVRLFTNPVPNGKLGIAVMGVTVSSSLLFVTPGDGGLV